MRKIVIILTSAAVVFTLALSVGCEKPEAQNDFNITLSSDSVQTMPNQGDDAYFYFTLKNNTASELSVKVNTPLDLREMPEGWFMLICDDSQCYGDSVDVTIPASDTSQRLHLQMISGTSGTEGKAVMTVTGGAEVDTQTFVLRIGQ